MRWHGGVLAGIQVAANRRQGVHREHPWGPRVAPTGCDGGDAPRRRRDDGAEEAARDDGVSAGEAAPAVSGGLRGAGGLGGQRRRRGGGGCWRVGAEGEAIARGGGEKNFGRWAAALFLKGGGGEGALDGLAPRGGGVGERRTEGAAQVAGIGLRPVGAGRRRRGVQGRATGARAT
jgi:hypothetical protein